MTIYLHALEVLQITKRKKKKKYENEIEKEKESRYTNARERVKRRYFQYMPFIRSFLEAFKNLTKLS